MAPDEKTSHEKNVPKVFRAAIWSAAVLSAGTFAFIVGLLTYNFIKSPISADLGVQANCPTGTLQYAINNYPYPKTTPEKDKDHQSYYKKWGGDPNWRCSLLCIPVPFPESGQNDSDNIYAAGRYLKDKCDAGIAADKKEFDALTGKAMLNTIILASLKPDCQGKNSKEYDPKILCEREDKSIPRTDTAYVPPTPTPTPTPTPKPKAQAPSKSGESSSAEGTQKNLSGATTAGSKSGGTDKEKTTRKLLKSQLKSCISLLDKEIPDTYGARDFIKEYLSIKKAKPVWSTSIKNVRDRCFALLNSVREYSSKQPKVSTQIQSNQYNKIVVHNATNMIIGKYKSGVINKSQTSANGWIYVAVFDNSRKQFILQGKRVTSGKYGQLEINLGSNTINDNDEIFLYVFDPGSANFGMEGVKYYLDVEKVSDLTNKNYVRSQNGTLDISFTPFLESFKNGAYGKYKIFIQNACQTYARDKTIFGSFDATWLTGKNFK